MIASLDWGGSFADAVLWDGKLLGSFSAPSRLTDADRLLRQTLHFNRKTLADVDSVALTGGDARRVGKRLLGKPVRAFNELSCIAKGAFFLSKKRKAVAVSCGTGTAIVYYDGDRMEHLGGTGVGGGTLEGLGKWLLSEKVENLERLALSSRQTLDLTVGNIVGGGIGRVPAEATASNFGNTEGTPSRGALAKSLLHLVAETIATTASLASEKTGCDELVFIGRVAKNKVFRERLAFTAKVFGKRCFFPENGEFATALGAALSATA